MKKIYTSVLFVVLSVFSFLTASAQNDFFADASEARISVSKERRVIVPQKFRTIALNNESMKNFLWSLPEEKSLLFKFKQAPVITLPMPDGRPARFNIWESSIQEPGLEAKFPDIKTFAGQGIDDPSATLRLDYTPNGFHAQVITVNGSYYIDPYARGLVSDYISYFRSDYAKANSFLCEVPDDPRSLANRNPVPEAACRGTEMRIYRLAVACTGEYAQAPGVAAGTNPATLHAAIVTTVNRVVGVYERDITVRLVLVANNNVVEYLNAATDPFNGNNDANTLINESQVVIDANIGSANYDIGHTFSTGGGGLAQLNSPCGSSKARGITGSPSPTGDAYDIDYVAHEMGHQLGGNHTMAGCGSSPNSTKLEVGSGTSIQAYAGICGAENIQPNSDPFFHSKSFDEISNFLAGFGSTCGTTAPTGNNIPVIAPLNNNGVTIPINTPFTLSATATDPDGDPLIYSWEQQDFAGPATWNAGASAAAGNTVPLFKMRLPKTTGNRTFPDPTVINANFPANPPSAMNGLKGETLSPVARPMTFRFIARDSKAAGGGVASSGTGGCQSGTTYTISVAGTSPFTVLVPSATGLSYAGNSSQTVTWDVAATNTAPFNTANVRISLSTDGGLTFPTQLIASTPNDGSEAVTIPNTATTTAKIKVEAIENVFFDVSNNNFTITAAVAGFTFNAGATASATCPSPATIAASLGTTATGGFSTPIVLSATAGVPAGTTVTFAPNPLTPGSATFVTLNNANTLSNGTYNVTVQGVAGSTTQTTTVSFVISAGTAPTVTAPVNVTVCAGATANFSVTASGPAVTTYQWQVNTGTGFADITGANSASYTTAATTAGMNGYQYRVIATGQCGTATSTAATLTVNTAPAIGTQPASQTVCAGTNATFSVTATGAGLTYVWQLSTNGGGTWNAAPGANTGATYTVTGVTLAQNNYQYRVIVSGTCPSPVTSSAAVLTVGNSAAITTQPVSQTVCVGVNPVNFTVAASGSSLTYQWQVNTGTGFTNIPGATATTYNAGPATAAMNGYQYRVNVFSCTPTPIVSSVVTLTVNSLAAITVSPMDAIICAGSSNTFSVTASGTAITYQWQLSTAGCGGPWTNIATATAATLNVTNVTAAMNGYAYRVVVTNSCNTVTSNCATLTVNTPIVVTTQPVNAAVCLPTTTASFSVAVTGTAPTYQWQVSTNGGTSWTNVPSATAATLNLTGLTAAMNGYQYRVVIAGTCTTAFNSSVATLAVNSPVLITAQPQPSFVCDGANASFTVAATGSTITYQWQVSFNGNPFVNIANAAPYSGATTATLSIANPGLMMSGYQYRVIVSGVPCGSVNSNSATLTVNPLPGVVLVAAEYNNLTPYTPSGLYSTVSPATGTYTYSWTRDNGVLPGVTTSSIPVNVDWFGSYDVTVTDQNGCRRTSNKVTIADSVDNLVFIYPNPSTGVFQVRYYAATNTEYSLNVYDSRGGRVWSRKYPVTARYQQMLVDLGRNASGVYLVEIKGSNGKRLASGKVSIQR